jgi:hypothetical protein
MSPMSHSDRFRQALLDLAWSQWGELGVAGWIRCHADWAVDPEPLILFTAALGEGDPRLRDESTDWCIRYGRYISVARLRNLLRDGPSSVRAAFGEYAATVNAHAALRWPEATHPRNYRPTGRSKLGDFTRPALIALRLRAMFGVSARAEILRTFVAEPRACLSAADLAAEAGYTKRNVEKELDSLRLAGLLVGAAVRNQLRHRLARPQSLLSFVGERPASFPRWSPILRVLLNSLDLFTRAEALEPALRAVEVRRTVRMMADHLAQASLESPDPRPTGPAVWAAFEQWALRTASMLADGSTEVLRLTPT